MLSFFKVNLLRVVTFLISLFICFFVNFYSLAQETTGSTEYKGELLEVEDSLSNSNENFWAKLKNDLFNPGKKFRKEKYSLEEHPEVIARLNTRSSQMEQITNRNTYEEFSYKDPKLLRWNTVMNLYVKKHGNPKKFVQFIFSGIKLYSLEEIPGAVAWLNKKSAKTEQITDIATYERFRFKNPRLPSWVIVVMEYVKKHDTNRGVVNSLFRKQDLYNLREVPEAIIKLNKRSAKTEQITSIMTYKNFYYKDPRLPSWSTLTRRYVKIHGKGQGLIKFVLSGLCAKVFSTS